MFYRQVLNKIWTIYSHLNGLQPYNTQFLVPNKSFDDPPRLILAPGYNTVPGCCIAVVDVVVGDLFTYAGMWELEGWTHRMGGTRTTRVTRVTQSVTHLHIIIHTFLLPDWITSHHVKCELQSDIILAWWPWCDHVLLSPHPTISCQQIIASNRF